MKPGSYCSTDMPELVYTLLLAFGDKSMGNSRALLLHSVFETILWRWDIANEEIRLSNSISAPA